MDKRDWTVIAIVGVLAIASFIALGVLTLMNASEYLEFLIAMFMFIVVLVGCYLFVVTPQKQRREERDTD